MEQRGNTRQPLRLRIRHREQWGRFHNSEHDGRTFFYPTLDPPRVGTPVEVALVFEKVHHFCLPGMVVWRRMHPANRRLAAGAGIEVQEQGLVTLRFLDTWTGGRAQDKRTHRRIPVKLGACYHAGQRNHLSSTRDISEGGVFVETGEAPAVGSHIDVLLGLSWPGQPPWLEGVVARLSRRPPGIGIRLCPADTTTGDDLAREVRRLEHRLLGSGWGSAQRGGGLM